MEELELTVIRRRRKQNEKIIVISCELNGCEVFREPDSKKIYWTLSDYEKQNKLTIIRVKDLTE